MILKKFLLKADRIRIIQVISNLLSNALKFTAEGTISIVSNVNDNEAIITIHDTGQGIDPDILPKLFSKFTTKSFSGYWIRVIYFEKYCGGAWR